MSESPAVIPFEHQSFDVRGIADVLHCSQSKVFALIASGKLRTYKQGRSRRATGQFINDYRAALIAESAVRP